LPLAVGRDRLANRVDGRVVGPEINSRPGAHPALDMARDNAGFHDSLLGVGWLRQAVGVAQTAAVERSLQPISLTTGRLRSPYFILKGI
jgi:hypothetical protein